MIERFTSRSSLSEIASGASDSQDLGIKIFRFNVEKMEILDESLKKVTQKTSKEWKERLIEKYEMRTELDMAIELQEECKKRGKDLSIDDAWHAVKRMKLIEKGAPGAQDHRKDININGLENLGVKDLAAAIVSALNKK